MIEEYRDIAGYEGIYQVSNYGNVKSLNYRGTGKENILKPRLSLGVCSIKKEIGGKTPPILF